VRRVLFDEDVPRDLRRDLPEFSIRTVQEQSWSSLKNGELPRAASREFAVFVTADKNLQYQQNIPKFRIGVVVLASRDTRLPSLRSLLPEIRAAVTSVQPGTIVRVPTDEA
jgi:hypothetical protein